MLTPSRVRALARALDIKPTKTLGQNFLHDANTIRRIVAAAELAPDDVVLEVGPGLGSLTLGLLPACRRVIAVEIDERLAAALPGTVAAEAAEYADRLDVVTGDALRLTTLPTAPTALVANLPYNVAVPVVLHLLATFDSLQRGLVMVQSEVAARLVAPPGSRTYGVPSAKLAWFAAARKAGEVPRGVFWPEPNVDSSLVAFTRRPPPVGPSREAVFAVIDAAFSQRRKTLRAALAGWAGSAAQAAQLLTAAGVDPSTRGEQLDVAAFAAVAAAKVAAQVNQVAQGAPVAAQIAPVAPHRAERTVVARVPAKVNLQLHVGQRREDGYHELETVFCGVSLFDEVRVAAAPQLKLAVTGEGANRLRTDSSNLAVRAVRLLAKAADRKPAVAIQLLKRIPIAAGLAGGSADAAGVLLACNELWRLGHELPRLAELAAELGSDVPFALRGGLASGTGRGERLTELATPATYHWVLAIAARGLSTPAVYAELDRLRADRGTAGSVSEPAELREALSSGDAVALSAALHNDLELPADVLRPELAALRAAGRGAGAVGALVSGSGPTVALLARDRDAAAKIARGVAPLCRSTRIVTAPAVTTVGTLGELPEPESFG